MDEIAERRFWELSEPPDGVYPTLDQWTAAIEELRQRERAKEAAEATRVTLAEADATIAAARAARVKAEPAPLADPASVPAVLYAHCAYASSGVAYEELSSRVAYECSSAAYFSTPLVNGSACFSTVIPTPVLHRRYWASSSCD